MEDGICCDLGSNSALGYDTDTDTDILIMILIQ